MKVADIGELKNSIDIVKYIEKYVHLEKKSSDVYVGLCPFHNERTPSFTVEASKKRFRCFGCGVGSDLLDFTMLYHKMSFPEAVRYVCDEAGVELTEPPSIIRQIKKYQRVMAEKMDAPRVYLVEDAMDEFPKDHNITEWINEGISYEILEKHDVRYDYGKTKILFPIYDEQENRRIIAIKARTLLADFKARGMPKYTLLGKMGTKDFLYAYRPNLDAIRAKNEMIIVEAEKSVMKLESVGIHNVVAAGSHFISPECERLILKSMVKNVVFAYDEDVPIGEIQNQSKLLRHYANCYMMQDKERLLEKKDSPIDRGIDIWDRIYANKRPL